VSDFFTDASPEHPAILKWLAVQKRVGAKNTTLEMQREHNGQTYLSTNFVFTSLEGCDTELWSVDLDLALLRAGFRAKTPENEAQRMSLTLKQFFSTLVREYGDKDCNEAFVDILQHADLRRAIAMQPQLKNVLAEIPPCETLFHNGDCQTALHNEISRCAAMLTQCLMYNREEATEILACALAHFLSERYNLTG
jgi:hypothetical protein